MSRTKTFVVAAASLIGVTVGATWIIAHKVNTRLREFAEMGETMTWPT